MNIKTVKLKNSGFNGGEVHHIVEVVKNNRKTVKPIKEYPKDPIHKDLENLFKDLREYLLDICEITHNMDEKEKMFTLHESEVTGVEFDNEGFILHGFKNIFGNKKLALNPPKIEEIDNYQHFEEVMDIIKQIASETELYIQGEKKVSDEELAERWIMSGKDKAMDMDTFKGLTAEEQRDFCAKLLENQFGSIVIHQDESVPEGLVVDVDQEFTIDNNQDEVVIPVSEKKTRKKAEAHAPESKEEAF